MNLVSDSRTQAELFILYVEVKYCCKFIQNKYVTGICSYSSDNSILEQTISIL
jgi:hypothetical protein